MAAAMLETLAPRRRWLTWAPGLHGGPILLWLLPLVALTALSTSYLATTGETVTLGATVQHLRADRDNQREVNRQLEFELAKLQSLTWVENEAIRRLGMQRAVPAVFLVADRALPPSSRVLPASLARRPVSPGVGERVSIWGTHPNTVSPTDSPAQP